MILKTQLKDQVRDLNSAGFDVEIISSPGIELHQLKTDLGVKWHPVQISRSIDLIKDLNALIKLYWLFKAIKPIIVHSTTPKAGLLSSIAAFFSGVPIRLHTFTGQPWFGHSGIKSYLAKKSDVLICKMSTKCYADSFSQMEFLISKRITNRYKLSVLASGSLAGVDTERFNPNKYSSIQKSHLLKSLGLPSEAFVFIFVGRINPEKGITELVNAFRKVEKIHRNAWLLLVGDEDSDGGNKISNHFAFEGVKNIIKLGYKKDPEFYLSISHVLVIPSYREGFGTVVIEAASMGVPAIGSKIYGLQDAILDQVTGLLVKPRSEEDLVNAMLVLISNRELAKLYGVNARNRVLSKFSSKIVNGELITEYRNLIKKTSYQFYE